MKNAHIDEKKLKNEFVRVCNTIYPNNNNWFKKLYWPDSAEKLMRFGWENRISFLLVQKLLAESDFSCPVIRSAICKLQEKERAYTQTLRAALMVLEDVAEGEPWLLIKTLSSYPHYTSDIDVLVRNESTKKRFESQLLQTHWNRNAAGEIKEGFLPIEIDVQSRISWTNSDELSPEFVWGNIIHAEFEGVPFQQPNPLCDTLLRVGHIAFELAEIRLGELLHIFHQSKSLDWSLLEQEALLMAWPKSYRRIMLILSAMHHLLFDAPFANLDYSTVKLPSQLTFPYRLSYSMLAAGVIEKRAWKKCWGARYVLRDRLFGVMQ